MTRTGDARESLPRRSIRGVTLVEILAVTAIIGSLAAIGIPRYRTVVERARVAKAIGDIQALGLTLTAQDSLPDNLTSLGTIPVDPWGPCICLQQVRSDPSGPGRSATRSVPGADQFQL